MRNIQERKERMKNKKFDIDDKYVDLKLVLTELEDAREHLKKSFYWVKQINFLCEDTKNSYKKEMEYLMVDISDLMSKIKYLYNSENPDKPKPKVII